MICDNCNVDRKSTDFINNQKFCYQCEFRKKIEKDTEKQTRKTYFCRICKKEIEFIENAGKRQRDVFCSYECAEEGHKQMCNSHWTRRIRRMKYDYIPY